MVLYTCSDGFQCASRKLMEQREERLKKGLTEREEKSLMRDKRNWERLEHKWKQL